VKEVVHPSPIPPSVTAEKYAGEWVAILRRSVVDHDADLDSLFARLDEQGIGEKALIYNVPRPGVVWA